MSPDPFALENHATVLAHENVLRRMSAPTGTPIAVSHEDVADRDIHLAIPVDLCQ